jgi:hypothetical protein
MMPREREASTDSDKAYWVGPGVPRAIPAGRVLAHDRSRFWTWPRSKVPRDFVPCPCGRLDLPHVAKRDYVERQRRKRDQLKFDF